MYEVIVRKPLKHPDDTEGFVEMRRSVNHEMHALNLAERIVRMDRVPWVEIREVHGRFAVRASLEADGDVHGSLSSRRHKIRRKRSLAAPWLGGLSKLALITLIVCATSWYGVSIQPDDARLWLFATVMTFATGVLISIWAYARKRRSASRLHGPTEGGNSHEQYTITGRRIR
jgi:hypothetical protein